MTEKSKAKKEKEKELRSKLKYSRFQLDHLAKEKRTAIALRYDIEKDIAPVILAAGRGEFAEEILKVAEDNKIPFYEDKGLADLLLKLEVDTEIPQELYVIIAGILAFVFRLDQMAAKRDKLIKKTKEMEDEER